MLRIVNTYLPCRVQFSVPSTEWRRLCGGEQVTWEPRVRKFMVNVGEAGALHLQGGDRRTRWLADWRQWGIWQRTMTTERWCPFLSNQNGWIHVCFHSYTLPHAPATMGFFSFPALSRPISWRIVTSLLSTSVCNCGRKMFALQVIAERWR